jgi:hypothetical protein
MMDIDVVFCSFQLLFQEVLNGIVVCGFGWGVSAAFLFPGF